MREFKDAKDNVRREIEEGLNEKDGSPVNTNNTSSTSTSKANSL
jgi:hypothetical protein